MTRKGVLSYFLKSIEDGFQTRESAFDSYIAWLQSKDLFEIDCLNEYKVEFGFKIKEASRQEENVSQWDLSSDRDSDFKVAISNGWVSDDFIASLLVSDRQIKFNGNAGYPKEVTSDIFRSAIQILGRLNCPFEWETTEDSANKYWKKDATNYYSNKKGLVYGQVQSGKTASMLMLTQLALEAGYNLIIHLSSDKESLRTQTQNRLNNLFEIQGCHSSEFNLWSPTQVGDYLEAFDRDENAIVKYDDFRLKRLVICVKKNIHHLNQLYEDLNSLKNNFDYKVEFSDFVKCLFVDDEADYASQNTSSDGRTAINEVLTKLRKLVPKNSYVGYTATPQACFGASESALVGYPSDFVYPIVPYTTNGLTTYTGAKDFFLGPYSDKVIRDISPNAWPFWNKISGRAQGIYDPNSGNLVNDRLNRLIEERLDSIKDDGDDNYTGSLILHGLKTFLISTAIIWYRHAKSEGLSIEDLTKDKVAARNVSGTSFTRYDIKQFPDCAMMFNVVLEMRLQEIFRSYIQKLFVVLLNEYEALGFRFFASEYELQREKTKSMINHEIPELDDLDFFLEVAMNISMKEGIINNSRQQVYLLNSSDEGSQLDYSNTQSNFYPKCASIFVGGLILGRGITVEGLHTSIFLRSQSASMSDTNLQMCRWFGHKRNYFDLCTLYIQEHNLDLFREIAFCDERSRRGIINDLIAGVSDARTVNALFSSELFRLTSPNKSRALVAVNGNSMSNRAIKLNRCKIGEDWMDRSTNVIKYLNTLVVRGAQPIPSHERAFTLKDVSFADVRNLATFWESSHLEYDQLLAFLAYMKYNLDNEPSVPIHIGLFGVSFMDGKFYLGSKIAKRGISESGETKLLQRTYDNVNKLLRTYGGGSKKESQYAGDKFIDLSKENHAQFVLEGANNSRDLLSHGVLINLYFLDANYRGKSMDKLTEGSKGFSDNGIVAAILHSCTGGAKEPMEIQVDRLKEFFDNESKS